MENLGTEEKWRKWSPELAKRIVNAKVGAERYGP